MTKIVTGSFKFGNGQPVANGTVYMKLVQDATVAATGQIAPAVVSFPLDINGSLGSGVTMFASDELTPTNIAYAVTVTTQGGGQVYGPEFFVISGTSPISLNNLLPSANSPVVFSTAVLTNPTAEQAVTGFPLSLIALDLPEAAAPANPPPATVRLYSKSSPTEGIYFRNSVGTETGPIQALAGNAVLLNPTGTQTIIGFPLVAPAFETPSANPAATGIVRLASTDQIGWRNNANSADVILQKTGAATGNLPADILSAAGLQSILFSSTNNNMAASGAARLTSGDTVAWRNNANSGDIAISKNASDVLLANGNPISVAFGASGANHSLGLVPDPGSSAGTAHFLREDATWATPASAGYKIEFVSASPVTASNTTNETTLMTFNLPANELAANQDLRVTGRGTYANSSGSTVSYTWKFYVGSNVIQSVTFSVLTGSNLSWRLAADVICVTTGSSGTIEGQSDFAGFAGGADTTSTNTSTFTLDTTSAQTVKVTITMNLASSSTTTTQRQMVAERLN